MAEPKTDQPYSLQGMPTMAAVTGKVIIRTVEQFLRRPEIHGNLDYLSNRFSGLPRIVVAGGAVRNAIIDVLHGHASPTGDIDLSFGGLGFDFCLSDVLESRRDCLSTLTRRWSWISRCTHPLCSSDAMVD